MKVLIIEREKTLLSSLSHFLEKQKNFEVYQAQTKKDGLDLWKVYSFDLVLCADYLPDGRGLDILPEFICQKPEIITILMSGQHEETTKQEVGQAGIKGYLKKPFDLKELEEAIGLIKD
jgi:DNA-binding response OmpR family regulator